MRIVYLNVKNPSMPIVVEGKDEHEILEKVSSSLSKEEKEDMYNELTDNFNLFDIGMYLFAIFGFNVVETIIDPTSIYTPVLNRKPENNFIHAN